jgi:hypothetical protein|tara:strand:- start:1549 stop:1713 length:165 start_codon:yes stop_codon:yes gene_type:complete
MENKLFDKYFGPPMNMPELPAKKEGVNYLLIGGLLISFLFYNAYIQSKYKKEEV